MTQWIFLNHRPIHCPLILKVIKIAFEERCGLFSNRGSNMQDLRDKNMFIIFFFKLSPTEFTFVNENGKRHVIFYNMHKILNDIKNCIFKCLANETKICAAISDFYETQPLLKQVYLKFKNKNITKENKVATIGLKRKRITSTIVINKRLNKESNNMKVVDYEAEENINSQIDIASTKHTNLYEDNIKKIYNNVNKTPSFTNLAATNDFIESRKTCNYHDDNDNDFGNMISPLSEWSNWSYYTNNKQRDSAKNVSDKIFQKDIHFPRFFNYADQFDFLPRKLHGLLRHRHVKLTNVKCFDSPNNTISRKQFCYM